MADVVSKWTKDNAGNVQSSEFIRCSLTALEDYGNVEKNVKLREDYRRKAQVYALLAIAAAQREHTEAVG